MTWKAPWMYCDDILYRCGDYHSVPLLGLWGAMNYVPLLFRRQTSCEQFIPATHDLGDPFFTFDYDVEGAYEKMKLLNRAWQQRFMMKGIPRTFKTVAEYPDWQKNRGGNIETPTEVVTAPPSLEKVIRELEASEIKRLSMELEQKDWMEERTRKDQEISKWIKKKEDFQSKFRKEQEEHLKIRAQWEEATRDNESYKKVIKGLQGKTKRTKKTSNEWKHWKIDYDRAIEQ